MRKFILISLLFCISSQAQLLKAPGCFHLWKEYYQIRNQVQNKNSYNCTKSSILFWETIGENRGEMVVVKLWGNRPVRLHAIIYSEYSDLYYDLHNDDISKRPPFGSTVLYSIKKFSDIPEFWK